MAAAEVFIFPTSYAQQRLWFIEQLSPGGATFNIPIALRLRGGLDTDALDRSFREIVRRHESLRTTFAVADGRPVQLIAPASSSSLHVINLERLPAGEREREALRLAEEEARRVFDLTRGPLVRTTLLRLGDDEHVLLLTMHHIISDGWSTGVLIHELSALYQAFSTGRPSPLPELTVQYADFTIWQRESLEGEFVASQLDYWKRQLGGPLPVLDLPTDRPRPAVPSGGGAKFSFALSGELSAALKDLSRREDATLFITLLTALQVLLYRYTGQTDFCVGTPTAGRTQSEMENLIGCFLNTLVLSADISGNPPFHELLRRTRQVAHQAYANQDVPIEMLLEVLQPERHLSHNALFQVLFTFQNTPMPVRSLPGLTLDQIEIDGGTSKFDLTLDMDESEEGLHGWFEYSTDLFERETIARMAGRFRTLLESIVETPHRRVADLSLMTEAERRQLLLKGDGPRIENLTGLCVHQLFEEQAARRPAAIAVVSGAQELSYAELNERANQLAHYLQKNGVGPESRVGISMERSVEMMVALLGVLKAGAAYVPLDPAYPRERLSFMLADAQVELLLTQSVLAASLPAAETPVVALDGAWEWLAGESVENVESGAQAQNLAYLIYTSGSTGLPKGVMIQHGALAGYTQSAIKAYDISPADRVLQFASINFDASAEEIYASLAGGATLILRTDEMISSASHFLRRCGEWRVTVLDLPTAYWHELTARAREDWQAARDLRLVIIGGERALPERLATWRKSLGDAVRLVNTYGPTEATIVATMCELTGGEQETDWLREAPIGHPVCNAQAYVLDQYLRIVPEGIPGELYIGGDGLARGYLNHAMLTAERFVPHPFSAAPGARLYKTGDHVRYGCDGSLEFLGRLDQQVKVRGYRIELDEVETAISQHEAVVEVAVLAREDVPGNKRLVAYVALKDGDRQGSTAGQLREFLKQRLPDYMIPTAFVVLETLPLTVTGKVNRRALPAPEMSGQTETRDFVGPRDALEEMMTGIWAEVLGLERLGVHDNFFEVGGHSLLATQVIARVRETFKIEVALRSLFESPTIAEFAEVIAAGQREENKPPPPIVPVSREGELPLSFAQERLWFLNQLDPDSVAYHVPRALRLRGALDVELLERTFGELIAYHEILRTSFPTVNGRPVQAIHPPHPVSIPVLDLQELSEAEREERVRQLIVQEGQRAFDLARGPLMRFNLLRLGGEEHVLILTEHHLIHDGWTQGVLIRDFLSLYAALAEGAPSPLPGLPIQYADFAHWQREWLQGEVLERQLAYWKDQLSGAAPILELPTDRPRPVIQSSRGALQDLEIPAPLANALVALSRREGVTLFMVMLAAFQALLHRYSRQEDISIGSGVANRRWREIEGLLGMIINTVVLRTDLSGDPTFRELLGRVSEVCLGAYAHQDLPFEKLVEELQPERSLSHTPLFQVIFGFLDTPMPELELPGLTLSAMDDHNRSTKFDLNMIIIPRLQTHQTSPSSRAELSEMIVLLEYSTDLFDDSTITRLLRHFEHLLSGIIVHTEQRLSTLTLLSAEEEAQLLYGWNQTEQEYPRHQAVHQLFEQQVARSPEAIAVTGTGGQLTYHELNARSNQLARYLRRQGVGAETVVALCLERSIEQVISVLAVLKAGGTYLPLDPHTPLERLSWMMDEAQVKVSITDEHWQEMLSGLSPRMLCLGLEWGEIAGQSEEDLAVEVDAGQLAYVMYTSGSTGRPKGVMIPHRAILRLFSDTRYVQLDATSRLAHLSNPSFDAATFELWGALLHGARLVVVTREVALSPALLAQELEGQGVTTLFLTTALFNQMAAQAPESLRRCREVLFGGEASDPGRVRQLLSSTGAGRLLHVYGPTESTTFASWEEVREVAPEARTIPIGSPLSNTTLYVLDGHLRAVALGVVGELYIGGEGLARGYLHQPGLTAERFVPHPHSRRAGERLYRTGDLCRRLADGRVEFVGRMDRQVKVRGFRIELGEVEAVLGGHPGVAECVVEVEGAQAEEKRLVGYVVLREGASVGELRSYVGERLPEYMVPGVMVELEGMPLTANGKVDRGRLREARGKVRERTEEQRERTAVEEILAGVWEEVLGVEGVGVEDNFFELGGHSLLATQVMTRVREAFGVEVPLRVLFERGSIAGVAEEIEGRLRGGGGERAPAIERVDRERRLPLSFAQQRLWFLDQLEPGGAVYNIPLALGLRGTLDVAALSRTLDEIVRRHEVLRTTFVVVEGEPRQLIHPPQPLTLSPSDLSTLPEAERESTLAQLVRDEAVAPFDLSRGPLLRVRLLRLSADEHVLSVTMHHIISDGWSLGVLVREVAALYEAYLKGAESPLAELPIQYADYSVWQRNWLTGAVLDAQLSYWREQLAGAPAALELPTDRPRPPLQSFRGDHYSFALSPALSTACQALARLHGLTLFMLLLSGLQLLLSKYSGQADVVTGTPLAHRQHPATEALIGFFINTLVLRTRVSAEARLPELLAQVREVCLGAYAHQDLPFEKLVEELAPEREVSRAPLFQVMMVLQNAPLGALQLPGVEVRVLDVAAGGETAKFDLLVAWQEGAGGLLGATLEYNTDLFDAATVERMAGHYEQVLTAMVEGIEQRVWEVQLMRAGERAQVLEEWNASGREYPRGSTIVGEIGRRARERGEAVAVECGGARLSYTELERRANQLGRYLRRVGVGAEARVGVLMERGVEMVVGLLGALKAGGAYVPLDAQYPAERLRYMVEDSGVSVLLTQQKFLGLLDSYDGRSVCLDTDWSEIALESGSAVDGEVAPENLAYVIYTSGSSGRPKGVMVTHGNLANFFTGMDEHFKSESPGTWLAVTSISFDISVLELFWTLARGFRVVIQKEQYEVARVAGPPNGTAAREMDFSLFYFASDEEESARDRYRLLLEGAKFADRNGFTAVWTPERHFHAFGGLYPNPALTGAALAAITERVQIRAGSVVLPLHNPIRVAEEWAVVDNLSNGRAGISFASGWHADDFVFAPESYANRKEIMLRDIETVRQLWRGGSVTARGGAGNEVEVKIHPRPLQAELPIWLTAAGNPETFCIAGEIGAHLLTHLVGQSLEELEEKIAAYRSAWRRHGHGPGDGHVTLMLHTFVGPDVEQVKEKIRLPFSQYLKSSVDLMRNLARSLGQEPDELTEEDMDALLAQSFDRYFATSGLLGTPEMCLETVERLKVVGVDELACLIDFGVNAEEVISSLPYLKMVQEASRQKSARVAEDYSLTAQISRHGVTHMQCTPSLARIIAADTEGLNHLGSIPHLLLGGEALPASLAKQLREVSAGRIYNLYGPTETTIWSASHRIEEIDGAVPIGRPVANTQIYLLDRHLQLLPVGLSGEVYIGGEGVVRGYLFRPELTAEKFIPDPYGVVPGARLYKTGDVARYLPDGRIEFLGRADQQVKLRGYRIELGEIETALGQYPGVREVAVSAHEDALGEKQLVAYVVAGREAGRSSKLPALPSNVTHAPDGQPLLKLANGMPVSYVSAIHAHGAYREIFEDEVYLRHGVTLRDGDCVFDVGANIGMFTLFVHQRCKDARVYAFEPLPDIFRVLQNNVQLYGIDARLYECGIAERAGQATFTFYPELPGLSGRYADIEQNKQTARALILQAEEIPAHLKQSLNQGELEEALDQRFRSERFECRLRTLSEIIAEEGVEQIDLLKIDVEKSELDVLQGILDEDWKKIRQIVLEVESRELLERITALLDEKGYQFVADQLLGVGENGGNPRVDVYMLYASRRAQGDAAVEEERGRDASVAGTDGRHALSLNELRVHLKSQLPDYMIPSTFVFLDALPLTPNGKTDYRSLPAPLAAQRREAAYTAPRNELEQLIAGVWRQALRLEKVGIYDNFFELGGHSLLVVQVHSELRKQLHKDLSIAHLFRYPTIDSLAGYLSETQTSAPIHQKAQEQADRQKKSINRQKQLIKARKKES